MPTKADLIEQIMQNISDTEHTRRAHAARVRELEADIEHLEEQNKRLQGTLRVYFIPTKQSAPHVGTAHCPVCAAVAVATLINNTEHLVVTEKPLVHHKGCIFATQVGEEA